MSTWLTNGYSQRIVVELPERAHDGTDPTLCSFCAQPVQSAEGRWNYLGDEKAHRVCFEREVEKLKQDKHLESIGPGDTETPVDTTNILSVDEVRLCRILIGGVCDTPVHWALYRKLLKVEEAGLKGMVTDSVTIKTQCGWTKYYRTGQEIDGSPVYRQPADMEELAEVVDKSESESESESEPETLAATDIPVMLAFANGSLVPDLAYWDTWLILVNVVGVGLCKFERTARMMGERRVYVDKGLYKTGDR